MAFKIIRRFCSTNLSLLEQLQITGENPGFNGVLSKIKIIKAGEGNCVAELKLEEEHLNSMQTLHSGLSVTLMDVLATHASMTHEKGKSKFGLSVNMHFTFFKTATLGDTIIIDTKTIDLGEDLGFLNCEIRNKATGDLLVRGSPTTYLVGI